MTTPTPAPTPDGPAPPPTLPGVREYEVSIPLYAYTDDGGVQFGRLPVRIPARSAEDAIYLGTRIAIRLNEPAEHPNWNVATAPVTAVDVDDTPSPAELTAQVDYLRRVLAVAVAKYPMLITMTGAEYDAADPAGFHAVPLGDDNVTFASPAVLQTPTVTPAAPAASSVTPVAEAGYGGHYDPDIQPIEVWKLARTKVGEVEIRHADQWMRLDMVTFDQVDFTVTILARGHESITMVPGTVVLARPATLEGYASDLPQNANAAGMQMLARDGWWNLDQADYMGHMAYAYKVVLSRDGEVRSTSIGRNEQVLLRRTPPGWWE